MGTFSVQVQVGDVQGGQWLDIEALVDTGATHTVIPQETARTLGIELLETVPFQLADDRTVECEVGEARVRLGDRERTVLVVVGESGVGPLLGATTLELFNVAADPVGRRLIRVPGLMKGGGLNASSTSYLGTKAAKQDVQQRS